MKPFTYSDYIYFILKLKNTKSYFFVLNDKNAKYELKKFNLHQPHDKLFKEILDDKEEAIYFLNKNLKIKDTADELKVTDIEKYNRKFITQDFYNMESDVIYKKVDEDIFFLIEHQSKIDYSMPYRILKYNMAIIESAIDRTKINTKDYKIPAVYSFVIYTGKQEWNVEEYINQKQRKLKGVANRLFASFQVIDVNKYSEEELLESDKLLSKIVLLEKARNINQVEEILLEILNKDLDKKQILFLGRVINYSLNDKIDTNIYNKIIKRKLGGEQMGMNFIQIIRDYVDESMEKLEKGKKEIEDGKKEIEDGKKEIEDGKKEIEEKDREIKKREKNIKEKMNRIILGLINSKVDDKKIMELMEINENELLKIKKENHIVA